jgi:hypothetical protein
VQGEEEQYRKKDFADEEPKKPGYKMDYAKIFQVGVNIGVEQKFH